MCHGRIGLWISQKITIADRIVYQVPERVLAPGKQARGRVGAMGRKSLEVPIGWRILCVAIGASCFGPWCLAWF